MPRRKAIELKPEQLRRYCDPKVLTFDTTAELEPGREVGHARAREAIKFGLDNKTKGYNIFCLGAPGSGKTSILRSILDERAKKEETPPDWVYLYNFETPDNPQAFCLSAGMGRELQRDMQSLVRELKHLLPKMSEKRNDTKIEEQFRKKSDTEFRKLRRVAKKHSLDIDHSDGDLLIQAIKDGRPMGSEQMAEMSDKDRSYYEDQIRLIQDNITKFLESQARFEKQKQEKIRDHIRSITRCEMAPYVDDLKSKYKDAVGLRTWLAKLHDEIPRAFDEYQLVQEELQQNEIAEMITEALDPFQAFRVNLFVDNHGVIGAPVVFESSPTYHNLVGRMEYRDQHGMMKTDFTMVKAGALHRANGGYLVLQANDLLKSYNGWDVLKKVLRNKELTIQELDVEHRTRSLSSPQPIPIPLDSETKVILIGTEEMYYLLLSMDDDFERLFKVKAEFDETMPRSKANMIRYGRFIAKLCKEDKLLPFDRKAVAEIIEYGSRLADHRNKLSTRFLNLINIVSESNYWAQNRRAQKGRSKAKVVTKEDVCVALLKRKERMGKIEYEMYEQIHEGSLLLDVKGKVVGQINGIAVYDLGDHAFGIPSRITCRIYTGRSGIVNIDREAQMAGRIHNKAVMILIGLIGGMYAQNQPLSLSASITFEQSYGGVEGDSASCSELFALLSALSGLPIKQGVAVTGSVNQRGLVQPVGGVNEKIEGVFRICKEKGLTGEQGVILPVQNAINLTLDHDVLEAVKAGKFHVWTMKHIDDGIELVMGKPAAEVHKMVKQKLKDLHESQEG